MTIWLNISHTRDLVCRGRFATDFSQQMPIAVQPAVAHGQVADGDRRLVGGISMPANVAP
ncbi:MAG: hypothetical protein Q8R28_00645 [Dehalococcoidia bacterium]|nr:hypothetical protein [Dehalococcoidia bacterium]